MKNTDEKNVCDKSVSYTKGTEFILKEIPSHLQKHFPARTLFEEDISLKKSEIVHIPPSPEDPSLKHVPFIVVADGEIPELHYCGDE